MMSKTLNQNPWPFLDFFKSLFHHRLKDCGNYFEVSAPWSVQFTFWGQKDFQTQERWYNCKKRLQLISEESFWPYEWKLFKKKIGENCRDEAVAMRWQQKFLINIVSRRKHFNELNKSCMILKIPTTLF